MCIICFVPVADQETRRLIFLCGQVDCADSGCTVCMHVSLYITFWALVRIYTYNHFRVSSPGHTLHTAVTHVIIASHANSHEALNFQYFNHVSGCIVQCANAPRNPETTVLFVHMTSEKPSLGSICATFYSD